MECNGIGDGTKQAPLLPNHPDIEVIEQRRYVGGYDAVWNETIDQTPLLRISAKPFVVHDAIIEGQANDEDNCEAYPEANVVVK